MTRPAATREAHDRGDCDLWTCRYCDAENRATWTTDTEGDR